MIIVLLLEQCNISQSPQQFPEIYINLNILAVVDTNFIHILISLLLKVQHNV